VASGAHLIQPLRVLPRQSGCPGNRGNRTATVRAVQLGDDAMPDPVSGIPEILVRFVVNPRLAGGNEVLPQVCARDVEEGADQHPVARIDSAKTRQSGAPNELQQERLRLIVPRVPDRNPGCPGFCRSTVEEGVPHAARALLDGESLLRSIGSDVHRVDDDGKAMPGSEFAAELLVARSRWPQLMIEVSQASDVEAPMLGKISKNQRQCHRIGTARKGDEQTDSWRAQVMPEDRAPNLLMEACQFNSQLPTTSFQDVKGRGSVL
jgi:hypothetical protein